MIGGWQTRVEAGIGPTGRYFVRAVWLKPMPGYPNWQLVIWADTANPEEQLEALSALRTVRIIVNDAA
jgi:hypothetical protein